MTKFTPDEGKYALIFQENRITSPVARRSPTMIRHQKQMAATFIHEYRFQDSYTGQMNHDNGMFGSDENLKWYGIDCDCFVQMLRKKDYFKWNMRMKELQADPTAKGTFWNFWPVSKQFNGHCHVPGSDEKEPEKQEPEFTDQQWEEWNKEQQEIAAQEWTNAERNMDDENDYDTLYREGETAYWNEYARAQKYNQIHPPDNNNTKNNDNTQVQPPANNRDCSRTNNSNGNNNNMSRHTANSRNDPGANLRVKHKEPTQSASSSSAGPRSQLKYLYERGQDQNNWTESGGWHNDKDGQDDDADGEWCYDKDDDSWYYAGKKDVN